MNRIRNWQEHKGQILDSVNDFDVIDCNLCGFKHIVPIPSSEELEKVYRNEYYKKSKPIDPQREQEDEDWKRAVYSDRYDTLEEYLSPSRRRILDVGCGLGSFLLYGKQRAWQGLGIEPSTDAAAYSRSKGLVINEEFLDWQTATKLGKFDVVHMNAVLEHLPDPKGMLQIVRTILEPDGLLCVVVPNDYNPFQQALRTVDGYDPWWVVPPHHINYFDFESLGRLLSNNGFEILLRETSFPIDIFLLMGDNYVEQKELGGACHNKRKRFEETLLAANMGSLKRSLYRELAKLGIGREVFLVARLVK